MGEVHIKYLELEDTIDFSTKTRAKMDDYILKIGKIINTPIQNLKGTDDYGYAQSAANLANQKIAQLIEKKNYFSNIESTAQNILNVAKTVDKNVSSNISSVAQSYVGNRKWYEKVGDWIFNTFCVDTANHFSLVRNFVDGIKWMGDKTENVIDKIHNWFKYGDGQYVWKLTKAVVGSAVAIAGAIAAICAIPFSGGLSIPLVIACVGAVATSIGATITFINSVSTVNTSEKALSLSGNPFDDDDGKPGAARYYGSASKLSDRFKIYDLGDKKRNLKFKQAGKIIDTTKTAADTTAFVCNIANLGTVRDYRITTRNNNINYRYNKDEWYKGYSFTYNNIKRNIMRDMGFKITSGKLGNNSLGINLIDKTKQKTYTLTLKNSAYKLPEKAVNFFANIKTVDNTLNFIENVDGLYGFATDSDKSVSDVSKALSNLTGTFKNSKVLSIFDKYGTKTGKTIGNISDLIWGD